MNIEGRKIEFQILLSLHHQIMENESTWWTLAHEDTVLFMLDWNDLIELVFILNLKNKSMKIWGHMYTIICIIAWKKQPLWHQIYSFDGELF